MYGVKDAEKNSKKKIMLISPMLHQGGFERICVLTARLLQEQFDVVITVFSLDDIAYDISGLNVIDLNLKARDGKIRKLLNVVRRCIRLSKLQRKLKIDVSYSFGMTANIANAFSTGAKKKISACHSFEEIKNRRYMELIGKHTDLVLCCSKKIADLVQKSYRFSNVEPLWNPCDTAQLLELSKEQPDETIDFFETEDQILVSMGREDDVKGFWHLLKIFKRVHEERPDTRLAVIGDGGFLEYKEMVKKLKLEEKVCFTGLKKNPFPYLRKGDLYLLTSLSEGLPNALVEAMTLSLPIVSANCMSGPAEILHENWQEAEKAPGVFQGDYGILCPVLKEEKNCSVEFTEPEEGCSQGHVILEEAEELFADQVLRILDDKALMESYQKRSVQRSGDFSTGKYMEELLSFMEKL